jgi:hypothetical protein
MPALSRIVEELTLRWSNMRLSGRAVNKLPVALLRRAAQLWR